ncbi:MAG: polyprenyl diphosphate synthase [Oscillospiraceae bacterium]|nr:polyprenyl diphosphate synthase [Oscillospiraceae bacterium]
MPRKPTPQTTPLRHIAFIMDGNGRWARRRGMPREMGHRAGAKTFRRVVDHCDKIGIQAVTVYAFSTENWSRPPEEINSIMELLSDFLTEAFDRPEDQVEIRFLGDKSVFELPLRGRLEQLEQRTTGRKSRLNIALNYGSRAEIVHSVNTAIKEGKRQLAEDDISTALYTADCPDPDMIVRTGGDMRLSNFLLWQGAYAELYFTDTLWPDFTPRHVDKAVKEYYRRHRRYGGL